MTIRRQIGSGGKKGIKNLIIHPVNPKDPNALVVVHQNLQNIYRALRELDMDQIEGLTTIINNIYNIIDHGGDGELRPFFGLNNHLLLDYFGINPDFIKRTKNLIPNSGFEWYDPATMKPRDWTGDGVVDITEAWEGKASLKLMPGQTMQMETGVDPALWGEEQTRVSFRHKGGAVRVKAISGSTEERDIMAIKTLGWSDPSDTSHPGISNHVPTNDGRFMCAYVDSSTKKVMIAYIPDESFLTEDYAITDRVDSGITVTTVATGTAGVAQVSLYKRRDGKVLMIVADPGTVAGAWVDSYISVSGNGNDFAYLDRIRTVEAATTYSQCGGHPNIPVEIDIGGGNKRLILTLFHGYLDSTYIFPCSLVYTSDNDGDNWDYRYIVSGSGWTYPPGQPVKLPDGTCLFEVSRGSGDTIVRESVDDGVAWASSGVDFSNAFSDAEKDTSYHGSYYYDELTDIAYRLSSGVSGGSGLYALSNPTRARFLDKTLWRFVHDMIADAASLNEGYCTARISEMPSGRVVMVCKNRLTSITLGLDISTQTYTFYDNSTDEGTGDPIINQQGEYLDYPAQSEWVYPTPPALDVIRTPTHNFAQGYHSFYFVPEAGAGPVTLIFENIDPTDPCYIDAVQMEPDFGLKWPSIYFPGPDSVPPEAHADTHATGEADPITPADIGAETPAGAQAKADVAEAAANAYTDEEIAALPKAFIALPDTPSAYAGMKGKYVAVNEAEDGLDFLDAPVGGGSSSLPLHDGTNFLCDEDGKLLIGVV